MYKKDRYVYKRRFLEANTTRIGSTPMIFMKHYWKNRERPSGNVDGQYLILTSDVKAAREARMASRPKI